MGFRVRARRVSAAVLVTAAVPAAAWAGSAVVSGHQRLQIKVTVTPARAGAGGAILHLHSHYTSTLPGGGQPPVNEKSLVFTEAKGMTLRTAAFPACKESVVIADGGDAGKACPAGAAVGHGTVVVNARPTVPKLIDGTVTAFNGDDNAGFGGFAKGSPELILYVKTTIGVNTVDYLHIVRTTAGIKLIGVATKPKHRGIAPGDYTLQTFDLTVGTIGKRSWIKPPATCTGHWVFALTLTNFFGQPAITARDSVPCTT